MMTNENLSIGFIGAGRVGFTLGRFFYEKNLKISGYYSKTFEHACDAADFTCSKSFQSIKELANESQVIFITVPDSCIYDVYLKLKDCDLKDKILCHCSGALSAGIFKDADKIGAYRYSVHPVFAISDKKNSYKDISKAFFTVEGNKEKMPVIEDILKKLGNSYQIICAENKPKYHASLAMSSNLVIGLYHIALRTLKECGFSDSAAVQALNPLFLHNAESVCQNGCLNALTGPVDRNDFKTVAEHLSAIDNMSTKKLYKLLSGEVLEIAKIKYPEKDYNDLENLLNKE